MTQAMGLGDPAGISLYRGSMSENHLELTIADLHSASIRPLTFLYPQFLLLSYGGGAIHPICTASATPCT